MDSSAELNVNDTIRLGQSWLKAWRVAGGAPAAGCPEGPREAKERRIPPRHYRKRCVPRMWRPASKWPPPKESHVRINDHSNYLLQLTFFTCILLCYKYYLFR